MVPNNDNSKNKRKNFMDEVETISIRDEGVVERDKKSVISEDKKFVRVYSMDNIPDPRTVYQEMNDSNIVIVNIRRKKRKEKELRNYVDQIKGLISGTGGEMVLLGDKQSRLMIVPPRCEILREAGE